MSLSRDISGESIWQWQYGQPLTVEAGGTARLVEHAGALTVLSDGVDPQLLLSGIGVLCNDPVRLHLCMRITQCVDHCGRLVPVGTAGWKEDDLKPRELSAGELAGEVAAVVRAEVRACLGEVLSRIVEAVKTP